MSELVPAGGELPSYGHYSFEYIVAYGGPVAGELLDALSPDDSTAIVAAARFLGISVPGHEKQKSIPSTAEITERFTAQDGALPLALVAAHFSGEQSLTQRTTKGLAHVLGALALPVKVPAALLEIGLHNIPGGSAQKVVKAAGFVATVARAPAHGVRHHMASKEQDLINPVSAFVNSEFGIRLHTSPHLLPYVLAALLDKLVDMPENIRTDFAIVTTANRFLDSLQVANLPNPPALIVNLRTKMGRDLQRIFSPERSNEWSKPATIHTAAEVCRGYIDIFRNAKAAEQSERDQRHAAFSKGRISKRPTGVDLKTLKQNAHQYNNLLSVKPDRFAQAFDEALAVKDHDIEGLSDYATLVLLAQQRARLAGDQGGNTPAGRQYAEQVRQHRGKIIDAVRLQVAAIREQRAPIGVLYLADQMAHTGAWPGALSAKDREIVSDAIMYAAFEWFDLTDAFTHYGGRLHAEQQTVVDVITRAYLVAAAAPDADGLRQLSANSAYIQQIRTLRPERRATRQAVLKALPREVAGFVQGLW